jgi:AraC family transcriptional regulator
MQPRIETLPEKKFIGKKIMTSFSNNKTFELWKSFMPCLREIQNNVGSELYSIEVYEPSFFETFNPEAKFEKWAAVEVTHFDTIPGNMETITSPEGLYAVFIHKGSAIEGRKTYQYIFSNWLPQSEFKLDTRPHFAVMGSKYRNDDPESEEELWIPIVPAKMSMP